MVCGGRFQSELRLRRSRLRCREEMRKQVRILKRGNEAGKELALSILTVTRWRTQQPADCMFLSVFRQVDARHGVFVVKYKLCKCFRSLGLADTLKRTKNSL